MAAPHRAFPDPPPMAAFRSGRHAAHLRLAVPPRLAAHPSFRFPTTPLPTPSKTRLPAAGAVSPYAAALLRILALHSLFLLAPAARALPSLPHLFLLPPLLAIISAVAILLIPSKSQPHPFPALRHLFRPALLLAASLLLRLASLHLITDTGLIVLADSAGALLARALNRPSRRRVISVAAASVSLAAASPSHPVLLLALPFASGLLSSVEHSVSARHVTRSRHARAAVFALAATFLSAPALAGLFFLGGTDTSDGVPIGQLWWLLLNAAVFGMALGRRQAYDSSSSSSRPSMNFAMTFVCTIVLELVYYPKLSLPGFLVCGFILWIASRELTPSGYVELGSADESVYEAVMGPVRHILSERKSRKIAAFLLINTAYMFVEFASGFMSDSLGLLSDACHMLFDCAALAIGLYASYIARLPANGLYNYGRGRFEVLSGYVNAVFLVLVGALIVLESFERILEPREISTSSLLAVSVGGLFVNIIGLVFFHEEHHHAHGGSCSHSHSHSHSRSHDHGHEDHHHDHVHQSADHEKTCSGHHGDTNKSHHHNHRHDSNNAENHHQHNHSCSHKHGHNGHMEHHRQGVDQAHQDCSSINGEQGLLEIPLINVHSHGAESQSCNGELELRETGNHAKPASRRHIDHNMEGIFLHVLADTMGSAGVVISTLLIKYKGWLIADPICSVFISIMIVASVLPLLRNSAEILLQRVPRSHEKDFEAALDDVKKINGVIGVHNVHLWNLTNTDIVGTFHLHISAEADKSVIRESASRIFQEAGVQDLTIQIECVER
ncbi:unnamed protein product [Triticum aestivum]|nr:uncharacterized protein LOC109731848 [Aegilops tauschii subsp. strangulata]XP_045088595.1 uncharacterized protein LOC109731848 [Aegilops tauschii subsp. strangulata]XP_045088596.1 uncharacterized protein LOC109731848 [Aegilops tauschii subsp. strangulata]XP_045088597.1 uncharacterized protein LOC109731848 [Aegilops tauschii subsp. strangulata]XP_045088598.1 uncharacterized protein LOC109731848 [Aegilops tauschii subsp. strangulata]XP_045088599.1 uncharacterized protein LOC109731848 [Aegilop